MGESSFRETSDVISPDTSHPATIQDYVERAVRETAGYFLDSDDWLLANYSAESDGEVVSNIESYTRKQLLEREGFEDARDRIVKEEEPHKPECYPKFIHTPDEAVLEHGQLWLVTDFSNFGSTREEDTLMVGNVVYNGRPAIDQSDITHGNISAIHRRNMAESTEVVPQIEESDDDYLIPNENGATKGNLLVKDGLGIAGIRVREEVSKEEWQQTVDRLEHDIPGAARELEQEILNPL